MLTEQALADIWAAVDASTASATKAAYRSDWARFTTWTTERGFAPLPAPPLVVAHYITEAAAEQTSVGKWRYTPATLSRWVSIDQPVPHRRRDGRSRPVRGGPAGVVRDPPDPAGPSEPAGTAAAERYPPASDIVVSGGGRLALGGGRPPRHGAAGDGIRRRAPPQRTRRPDPGRCHPAQDRRPARPAPVVEDRPGGPRPGQGPAVRAGPGHLPALRLRAVAGSAARLGHRPRWAAAAARSFRCWPGRHR